VPFDCLFKVSSCVFSKRLNEEKQEVKAIVIDSFDVSFEVTLLALLQLLLHKFELFQPFTSQATQTVEYAVTAGQLHLEIDLIRQQLLHSDQIVILDTKFERSLSEVVFLIAVESLFDGKHVDELSLDPTKLIFDLL
jgi:hypothetical protein